MFAVQNPTPSVFVAGVVSFVLDPSPVETASDVLDRITMLTEGVLVSDLTSEETANLEKAGFDVLSRDTLAVVTPNAEIAAKRAKAKEKPVVHRKTAEERRNDQVQSGALKFLKDKASMNVVKKLFTQYVGAEEDFSLFAVFIRELDQMVGEYRIHAGIDTAEPLDMDEDEEETDDFDASEVVATADTDGLTITVAADVKAGTAIKRNSDGEWRPVQNAVTA